MSEACAVIIDANVQPHFRYNAEIRRYLPPEHKLRAIPDVELQWYQAPGGDYRQDLYGDGYPGSDPDAVARHLFDEGGAHYAVLNPLTRGNIADYLLIPHIEGATELAIFCAWRMRGRAGALVGGLAFIVPGSSYWCCRRCSWPARPRSGSGGGRGRRRRPTRPGAGADHRAGSCGRRR